MSDKVDRFFDFLDGVADKTVSALKDAHYPGKEYDDSTRNIEDAEVVSDRVDFIFGLVSDSQYPNPVFHVFRGISNRTLCGRLFTVEVIAHRMRPDASGKGASVFCRSCVSRLIPFQTQSTEVKELKSGD